jgi:hypothetical protein
MRFAAKALMILAWLFYGSIPAQSAFLMEPMNQRPIMQHMTGDDSSHSDHKKAGHSSAHQQQAAQKREPCPHRGDMKHSGFCTACLTTAPQITIFENGKHVFAYPAPDFGDVFLTSGSAPPVPPPRS